MQTTPYIKKQLQELLYQALEKARDKMLKAQHWNKWINS